MAEYKEVQIYSKLLRIFGAYTDKFPNSNTVKIFEKLLQKGIKAIPKDPETRLLLEKTLNQQKQIPGMVADLLNLNRKFIKELSE